MQVSDHRVAKNERFVIAVLVKQRLQLGHGLCHLLDRNRNVLLEDLEVMGWVMRLPWDLNESQLRQPFPLPLVGLAYDIRCHGTRF